MSYESWSQSEMRLANTPMDVQNKVLELLAIVDKDGHSGASMGIYSGWVKDWAKDPVEITDGDSMLLPIWEQLKHLPYEYRKTTLDVLYKTLSFIPLTPLTGEDSEWMSLSTYGDRETQQNNRMSSVFRIVETGEAYWLNATCRRYPYYGYNYWCDNYKRGSITFPYDASTEPRYTYFRDETYAVPMPEGIDPKAWMTWLRDIYLSGTEPMTSKVIEPSMFCAEEAQERFFSHLTALLSYLKHGGKHSKRHLIDRLEWLSEDSETVVLEWTEQADEGEGSIPFQVSIVDKALGGALARMLSLINDRWEFMASGQQFIQGTGSMTDSLFWDPVDQVEHRLAFLRVHVPNKHYQSWRVVKSKDSYFKPDATGQHLRGVTVPTFVKSDAVVEKIEPFFYDKPFQIAGDHDDYLYQKRREFGFAHPKRHRPYPEPVADVNGSCDDPVPDVNE